MADVAQYIRDLQAVGHIGPLWIDERRAVWIEPLLYGAARLHVGTPGGDGTPADGGYDDSWDYASLADAMRAAAAWALAPWEPEPAGWRRHGVDGRRRPGGDASALP